MDPFVSQTDDSAQAGSTDIRVPGPAAARPAGKTSWSLTLVGLGFVVVACVCLGLTGVAAIANLFVTEKPRVEQALDRFMGEMSARDLDAAYRLFSSRAQKPNLASALREMSRGNNYALFRGYLKLELTELTFEYRGTTDPDEPQGLVATTSGIVTYSDGFSGSMDAVLEREQNAWRIYALQVNVPPSKIGNERQPTASRNFIDIGDAGCYTASTCSPLASSRQLSVGWSTSTDQAGRPSSFANRPTAELSPARLAPFLPNLDSRTIDGLQGKPDQFSLVQTRFSGSDPSDYGKRIANVASLAPPERDSGIGPRS